MCWHAIKISQSTGILDVDFQDQPSLYWWFVQYNLPTSLFLAFEFRWNEGYLEKWRKIKFYFVIYFLLQNLFMKLEYLCWLFPVGESF